MISGPLGNGVIGNTAVSGSAIWGSSPCSPATRPRSVDNKVRFAGYSTAPSSSGLGHHPLKVEARVRIPLGLQECFNRSGPVSAGPELLHGGSPNGPTACLHA